MTQCLGDQVRHLRLPIRGSHVERLPPIGDGGLAGGSLGHRSEDLLDEDQDVLIVGKGLIGLEHRELGVVSRVDPLVAKDPTDLEDTLQTADHQPLQIELGGDPEVHRHPQGVVLGVEGPGGGTGGLGKQDRGVDFDESTLLELAPQLGDDEDTGHSDLT